MSSTRPTRLVDLGLDCAAVSQVPEGLDGGLARPTPCAALAGDGEQGDQRFYPSCAGDVVFVGVVHHKVAEGTWRRAGAPSARSDGSRVRHHVVLKY